MDRVRNPSSMLLIAFLLSSKFILESITQNGILTKFIHFLFFFSRFLVFFQNFLRNSKNLTNTQAQLTTDQNSCLYNLKSIAPNNIPFLCYCFPIFVILNNFLLKNFQIDKNTWFSILLILTIDSFYLSNYIFKFFVHG